MNRKFGSDNPYSKYLGRRKAFPWSNKLVIDSEAEQLYFPEYMLPPLGYQEQTDIKKATRICEILESPMSDYINGFVNYFINDEESLKHCLNILSLKDSVDSSLIKKITFECGTPHVLPSADMDTPRSSCYYGKASVSRSLQPSAVATPLRTSNLGTVVSSQGRINSDKSQYSQSNSQFEHGSRLGWSDNQRSHSGNHHDSSSLAGDSIGPTPEYNDSGLSAPEHNPDMGIPMGSIITQNDGERNDEAHYMKVSQYRSFFIDVTKIITEMPLLGSDIMTAPQIMLLLLDMMIVPLLFEIIDMIIKSGCPPEPTRVFERFHEIYESDPVSGDFSSVNAYLESVLNNVHCKNSLAYAKTKGEISNFHFTTRLCNVPPTLPLWKYTVDQITDNDVGNLVALVATVTRVGAISVLDEEREYKCNKCFNSVVAKAIPELHYLISLPTKCPHWIGEGGERRRHCFGDTFIQGPATKRTDIQEIRCQSIARGSSIAYVGGTTPVILRRDITGTCVPGDNIHIIAFVKRRWNSLRPGKRWIFYAEEYIILSNDLQWCRCISHIFLDAINIEVMNAHKLSVKTPMDSVYDSIYYPFWLMYRSDEVAGRQQILEAMCTTLVSVDNAKLALLLTIIGGFPQKDNTTVEETKVNRWAKYTTDKRNVEASARSGQQSTYQKDVRETKPVRTQCHILLLGCPGTGKSQFLKYAKTLVDRHVTVSGTNCTSAGLTCTVIRDGTNSMLSAGALVLADGGLCCIDEFALIHPDDKACLHEAMEQQVISVAKVGIKCSLNCRCTIVAASNFKLPKGKNTYADGIDATFISQGKPVLNIDVPLPLLSRFDVVLVFTENPLNDNELVEFLLNEASNIPNKSSKNTSDDGGSNHYVAYNSQGETSQTQNSGSQYDYYRNGESVDWTGANSIKNYIEFIRTSVFPIMTESAKNVIHAYYIALRRQAQEGEFQGGPTIRTIESLVRLSQAHARLMMREHVSVFDTVSIIWMGEFGLQGYQVGTCSGNDQVVDRQGLFPNVRELFSGFCRHQESLGRPYGAKMGNGITTMEMYHYFEEILLRRLNLTQIETSDGRIGVYPVKESDTGMQD